MNDNPTCVVSSNETPDDKHDTPTSRATINMLSVDELDAMLERIRERRLHRVQQLEAIAKVKADEQRLELYMKFERQFVVAKKALARAEEQEQKAEQAVHKCRLLVMAMEMEVGEAEDA